MMSSLVTTLNMFPFTDVYGIVSPLRSTRGFVATSLSYSATVASRLVPGEAAFFGIAINAERGKDLPVTETGIILSAPPAGSNSAPNPHIAHDRRHRRRRISGRADHIPACCYRQRRTAPAHHDDRPDDRPTEGQWPGRVRQGRDFGGPPARRLV